jgi:hypothetical protein
VTRHSKISAKSAAASDPYIPRRRANCLRPVRGAETTGSGVGEVADGDQGGCDPAAERAKMPVEG